MQKPDYSKISPELRAKLEELDKQRPENQSLQKLQDIALMLQEIIMTDDEKRKGSNKTIEEFGALLTDARESLQTIANKEDKEFPDFAKPITDLLDKLVEAVNSKEYSPKIDVKVPDINVPTPQVTVDVDAPDMKGIEKLLKTEMPRAFEEAISKIPLTEIPEYPDRWDEVLEWLESIDNASRMKPVFPTQLKVVNPDGSPIGGSATYITILREDSGDPQITYVGKALPGTATSDSAWQIASLDENTNLDLLYADGGAFTQVYDNREGLTYA